jgi:hypothetical protein
MYLKIVFLGCVRRVHQVDQAYTRHLFEDEKCMTADQVDEFAKLVKERMSDAIRQLNGRSLPPDGNSTQLKTAWVSRVIGGFIEGS